MTDRQAAAASRIPTSAPRRCCCCSLDSRSRVFVQHSIPQLLQVDEARVRIRAAALDETDLRVRQHAAHRSTVAMNASCSSHAHFARSASPRCPVCSVSVCFQIVSIEFPELCCPPYTPSYACSGVIDALGSECAHFSVGDEVVVLVPIDSKRGAAAEFTVQPIINLCQGRNKEERKQQPCRRSCCTPLTRLASACMLAVCSRQACFAVP